MTILAICATLIVVAIAAAMIAWAAVMLALINRLPPSQASTLPEEGLGRPSKRLVLFARKR